MHVSIADMAPVSHDDRSRPSYRVPPPTGTGSAASPWRGDGDLHPCRGGSADPWHRRPLARVSPGAGGILLRFDVHMSPFGLTLHVPLILRVDTSILCPVDAETSPTARRRRSTSRSGDRSRRDRRRPPRGRHRCGTPAALHGRHVRGDGRGRQAEVAQPFDTGGQRPAEHPGLFGFQGGCRRGVQHAHQRGDLTGPREPELEAGLSTLTAATSWRSVVIG